MPYLASAFQQTTHTKWFMMLSPCSCHHAGSHGSLCEQPFAHLVQGLPVTRIPGTVIKSYASVCCRAHSAVRSTCGSYSGPGFNSRHTYGSSQLSLTQVPGDRKQVPDAHVVHMHTCRQDTRTHEVINTRTHEVINKPFYLFKRACFLIPTALPEAQVQSGTKI